jgi:glycine betaine/proline transport system substrate-binding protein
MVKVDFGVGVDLAHWKSCISQAECAKPKPSMYPSSPVQTVTTESFAAKASAAYEYLTKRAFTNADMNRLLVWVESNQADGETAAMHFLQTQEAQWMAWLPADVAAKVKKAVAGM